MEVMNNYLKQILDEINMMVAVISRDNTLISANKALLDFAKVKEVDIIGMAYWDLPWWQHSPDLQNKLLFAINDSYLGHSSRFNATHTDADGHLHEIDFIIKPVMLEDEPEYFIAMGYNITDLVSARKELTQREKRIKAFFDYSLEGYFFLSLPDVVKKNQVSDENINEILDQYRIESSNMRLQTIIGQECIDSKTIFRKIGIKSGLRDIIKETIKKGSMTLRTTIEVDSEKRHLNVIFAAIYNELDEFEGNFAIVRDVTSEVRYLENVEYLANKDYLTGINNRRSFFQQSELLYQRSKNDNTSLVAVMLDIDHFKKVNDTYGHDVGDIVIKQVANIIDEHICGDCILGRYGGEEYAIVLPGEVGKVYKLFENIRRFIENTTFNTGILAFHVTISIGMVLIDYRTDSLESAIAKADDALYESKDNGRNQSTIFVESIHGKEALDPLTGLYNEKSMKIKLSKVIFDSKHSQEPFWVMFYNFNIIKENDILNENRQLKTAALCISNAIGKRDFAGRYGTHGFLIVLKQNNTKDVEGIFNWINKNFTLGFSGMGDDMLLIKGGYASGSKMKDVTEMVQQVLKKQKNINFV